MRPGASGCDRPAGLRDGEAARESGEKCGGLAISGRYLSGLGAADTPRDWLSDRARSLARIWGTHKAGVGSWRLLTYR